MYFLLAAHFSSGGPYFTCLGGIGGSGLRGARHRTGPSHHLRKLHALPAASHQGPLFPKQPLFFFFCKVFYLLGFAGSWLWHTGSFVEVRGLSSRGSRAPERVCPVAEGLVALYHAGF